MRIRAMKSIEEVPLKISMANKNCKINAKSFKVPKVDI